MALVQLISLIVTELRLSGLNGWLALYLLLSLAAIAGISSLVSWLVLILLCVSALGGLVLLALRSG